MERGWLGLRAADGAAAHVVDAGHGGPWMGATLEEPSSFVLLTAGALAEAPSAEEAGEDRGEATRGPAGSRRIR